MIYFAWSHRLCSKLPISMLVVILCGPLLFITFILHIAVSLTFITPCSKASNKLGFPLVPLASQINCCKVCLPPLRVCRPS